MRETSPPVHRALAVRCDDERPLVVVIIEVISKCVFDISICYTQRTEMRCCIAAEENRKVCLPIARRINFASPVEHAGLVKNG